MPSASTSATIFVVRPPRERPISVSLGETYDGDGPLDGDIGNDTISASSGIGYAKTDFPSDSIIGGEGVDAVELILILGNL